MPDLCDAIYNLLEKADIDELCDGADLCVSEQCPNELAYNAIWEILIKYNPKLDLLSNPDIPLKGKRGE